MTAANSTPLSDGASAVLLASEEWAKERGLPVLAYVTEAQTAAVDHVHKREGLLMAPAYAMPRMLERAGLGARGLRLLRDPRGLRRPGALHAGGLGGRRLLQGEARPRRAARLDRPREAQRQRRLARRRPPLRRDRRADRRRPRQAAARGRQGTRRDQHLRRRRPGRRRDARRRRRASHERPLRAARQRAGRLDRSPASSACRNRSSSSAARAGGAGRLRAGCSPAPPPAAASASRCRRRSTGSGPNGPAPRARPRRSSSTPPGSPTRPSWSSCSASSTPASAASSATAASSSSARRRRRPARPAPRPRSGRWRASPARSARRSAAAAPPCSSSTSPRAARSQLDSTLRFLLSPRSAYVSGQVVRIGAGVAADAGDRLGAAARRARRRWSPAPRAGSARRSPTTLALDGATVVGLDVPQAGRGPARGRRRGSAASAIELDITAADAPERIAERFADGVDVVVHNAGVTRDRTIAKMPEERWSAADGDQPLQRGADQRRAARRRPARRRTAASSASPRCRGSPATPARPTTPPRRPA